jgi:hypothetical protein
LTLVYNSPTLFGMVRFLLGLLNSQVLDIFGVLHDGG